MCAAFFLAAGSTPSASRVFRAADTQGEDYPTVQSLAFISRYIEQRTDGRHRIQIFHSHQLGEEKETIAQTRAGAIDLNRVNVAALETFIPEIRVLSIPFLFRSPEHLQAVLDGDIGRRILDRFADHGLIGLAFYDAGARSIYNSARPIRTLADLHGLRLRVQQSDVMTGMMRALGAVPIELPFGQVAAGLATGIIDGAENNWPSYVATGHFRQAKFYTVTEHTRTPEVLVMSRKAWDSLPPQEQELFTAAARESKGFMRSQWVALERRSREIAEAAGVTVTTDFDMAAFRRAISGVVADLLADEKIKDLADQIRAIP